jgi:hypothetical protein
MIGKEKENEVQAVRGWRGVDLDGTLAVYDKFRGADHIGPPVPRMVARVKRWLEEGELGVKIFTARASTTDPEEFSAFLMAMNAWSREHIGVELEVTCVKDFAMVELWDDRAVSVIKNTGIAMVLDG